MCFNFGLAIEKSSNYIKKNLLQPPPSPSPLPPRRHTSAVNLKIIQPFTLKDLQASARIPSSSSSQGEMAVFCRQTPAMDIPDDYGDAAPVDLRRLIHVFFSWMSNIIFFIKYSYNLFCFAFLCTKHDIYRN